MEGGNPIQPVRSTVLVRKAFVAAEEFDWVVGRKACGISIGF
jgi:hypothetical protein